MKQILISDYQIDEDTYGDTIALCKIAFHYYNEEADSMLIKERDKRFITALAPVAIGITALLFAAFLF